MAEENTQPPQEAQKETAGEKPTEEEPKEAEKPEEKPEEKPAVPKKGKWLGKIPPGVILSPGGMILLFFALIIEIIDWIPLPLIDQIIELPLEIIFIVLFAIITKASFKSLIIPFIIERIPVLSDILPTWVIKMLA